MIPRIVHYCWFGNSPMPAEMLDNINNWKSKLPDYEFRQWSENNFSIENTPIYVQESYKQKKYAFVSDYVRLFVIYKYGGIYLDTDVIIKKDFEPFLSNGFFTSIEYHHDIVKALDITNKSLNINATRKINVDHVKGIGIQSAIFGAKKNHPYIKDCINFYNKINPTSNLKDSYNNIILPDILALCAEKYGFRYTEEKQELKEGIVIYEQDLFTGYKNSTNHSIAIHYAHNSWSNKTIFQKVYYKLSTNNIIKRIIKSKLFFPLFEQIRKIVWFK